MLIIYFVKILMIWYFNQILFLLLSSIGRCRINLGFNLPIYKYVTYFCISFKFLFISLILFMFASNFSEIILYLVSENWSILSIVSLIVIVLPSLIKLVHLSLDFLYYFTNFIINFIWYIQRIHISANLAIKFYY